jgi:hypothetical protein
MMRDLMQDFVSIITILFQGFMAKEAKDNRKI